MSKRNLRFLHRACLIWMGSLGNFALLDIENGEVWGAIRLSACFIILGICAMILEVVMDNLDE